VSSTIGITNGETIQVPAGRGVVVLTVADGDVAGAVACTLSAVTSIADGSYAGQVLIILNDDQDLDTITIKDAANTHFNSATDVTLAPDGDVGLMLIWYNSNWWML